MSPMMLILSVAMVLIVVGLLMAFLRSGMPPFMQTVILWVGVVLVVIGLLFLVTPVMVWVTNQLHQALGG